MLLPPLFALLAMLAPADSTLAVPNFRDLTIKTREVRGFMLPMVTTWYFRGARERIEHRPEAAPPSAMTRSTILQCDEKMQFQLDPREKEVFSSPIGSLVELSQSPHPFPHSCPWRPYGHGDNRLGGYWRAPANGQL